MPKILLLALFGLSLGARAWAADANDLTSLSLEDLLSSEVTSVAKRPQAVQDAAAAVFVISREDIRRSGARTIPDLLRMVPGMEVGELSGGSAAVAARGFNGRYSNKLLVLVDGRAVYMSATSGVLWDQQLLPLEEIQRIEVVRGPGAALWGANAVNGVINIISTHAVDSLGTEASVRTDSQDGGVATARVGVVGRMGALRLYATGRQLPHDEGRGKAGQGGFRYDTDLSDKDSVTLQGDVVQGQQTTPFDPTLFLPAYNLHGHFSGANLLGRWTVANNAQSGYAVQAYWDMTRSRTGVSDVSRIQYDLDLSRYFQVGEHNAIAIGAGYRINRTRTSPGDIIRYDPTSLTDRWYGAYLQDDISIGASITLTLGAKLEHNDFSGVEFQPSLRILKRLPNGALWAAVSRAARTPSMNELSALPSFQTSTRDLSTSPGAERLTAYEIGWRGAIGRWGKFDLTAYRNEYRSLLAGWNTYLAAPAPYFYSTVVKEVNYQRATGQGVEAAIDIQPTDRWKLKLAADAMRLHASPYVSSVIDLTAPPAITLQYDLGASPRRQLSLRSTYDLAPDIDVDAWFRWVDRLPSTGTPAYADLDLRLAWRPKPQLEFAVLGRNLLDGRHVEYRSNVANNYGVAVRRAVEISLSARY